MKISISALLSVSVLSMSLCAQEPDVGKLLEEVKRLDSTVDHEIFELKFSEEKIISKTKEGKVTQKINSKGSGYVSGTSGKLFVLDWIESIDNLDGKPPVISTCKSSYNGDFLLRTMEGGGAANLYEVDGDSKVLNYKLETMIGRIAMPQTAKIEGMVLSEIWRLKEDPTWVFKRELSNNGSGVDYFVSRPSKFEDNGKTVVVNSICKIGISLPEQCVNGYGFVQEIDLSGASSKNIKNTKSIEIEEFQSIDVGGAQYKIPRRFTYIHSNSEGYTNTHTVEVTLKNTSKPNGYKPSDFFCLKIEEGEKVKDNRSGLIYKAGKSPSAMLKELRKLGSE